MPTPTFLRDLAADVLNGRVSVTSAALAISLIEQAEALEGGLAKGEPVVKKERLFWSKASDDESLFLGVEGCDVLSSHYTALATAAHSFEIEGKGKARRVEVDSLEAAAELVYGWALEDGYDVAPCPADLLLPKKVALVWVEYVGWHLCLPGDLHAMNAPYSYWSAPIGYAQSYDDLGAKSQRRVNGCAEEAGIKLIVEWATADGYEVPPFPAEAAPVVEAAPSLVWFKEADPDDGVVGIHLCLPDEVSGSAAPYSYFDADEYKSAFSKTYTGLGAKTYNYKKVSSRKEGLALLTEWATADGYNVPAIPIDFLAEPTKVEPASKEEEPVIKPVGSDLDQLFAAFKAYLATPAGRPYRYYHINLWDDESGAIVGLEGDWLIEWDDSKEGVAKIKALTNNS